MAAYVGEGGAACIQGRIWLEPRINRTDICSSINTARIDLVVAPTDLTSTARASLLLPCLFAESDVPSRAQIPVAIGTNLRWELHSANEDPQRRRAFVAPSDDLLHAY